MRKDSDTALVGMIVVTQRRGGRQEGECLLRQRFAVEETCVGEVEAVEIEQIERIVPEAVVATGLEVRLQQAETWNAALIFGDDLAVDQGRTDAERLERRGNSRESFVQSSRFRVRRRTRPPSRRAWMR